MNRSCFGCFLTAWLVVQGAALAGEELVVLYSKHIWTLTQPRSREGYVLIQDGKIKALTSERDFPKSARLIDLAQQHLLPGLIDAHTHLGLPLNALGETDEAIRSLTPEMRVWDAYDPHDETVTRARTAGITSVLLAPGQLNPLGGQALVMSLGVEAAGQGKVAGCAGLKGSLAQDTLLPDRNPTSRAGLIALLRHEWQQARQTAGHDADPGRSVLQQVLDRRLPWFVQTQTDDEIEAALLLGREFNLRLVLVGINPRRRGVELLKKQPTPVILPPLLRLAKDQEIQALVEILNTGVPFAFGSFAPKSDPADLRTSAALAVQYGLAPYRALQGLSSEAASLLGIAQRIGTIEAGKDADLVVMSGDPLDLTSRVEMVWVNGRLVVQSRPTGKNL